MPESRHIISHDQAEPPFFIGFDLGGTNIKVGVVDDRGRTLAYDRFPTRVPHGPENACQRMAAAIGPLLAQARLPPSAIARIGLGTPGTMDIPAGRLLEPPNLPGWEQFPIRDRLAELAGTQVTFSNDAGAAAFGEYWQGSGRGQNNMILLTLGTGIGGGIILSGHSLAGEHSHGAECGHIIIDYHATARMCTCGQPGHLEAYAAGLAIIKRTEEALEANRPSSLTERMRKPEPLTPLMISEEAEQGDPLSLEIVLETARYLGIGIVSLMHTLDPSAVIIGGAMTFGCHETSVGRQFLARVRAEVQQRAFPLLAAETKIDYAQLGGDAGYIGVAGLARLDHAGR
ncbi:MAG TPA: ROK family protein [Pirellulales bacterium]|nr:ROK family protein [Pirellulales bacterium]